MTPTDEPPLDGLDEDRQADARRRSSSPRARSASFTESATAARGVGIPASRMTALKIDLSMPIAEPATPAPTYGTPSVSRKPCRAPSSPVVPWMIGIDDVHAPRTRSRPERGLPSSGPTARNRSGTRPEASSFADSAAGEESAVLGDTATASDFVPGRIERSRDRPRRDARDLALDRPPAEENGDAGPAHPAHHVTTRTSSTAARLRSRSRTAGGGAVSTAMTAAARSPVAAREREVGDVDPGLAEDRADAADHARHVVVAQIDDGALGPELERQAVDLHDTGVAPVKRVASALPFEPAARERHADGPRVVPGLLVARVADRETAVARHVEGVDVVDDVRASGPRALP